MNLFYATINFDKMWLFFHYPIFLFSSCRLFPLLAALIEKEEVQKLAAQVEYMRIVHMERNNRHIKPKPGGYFTQAMQLHSSVNKTHGTQTGKSATQQSHSGVSEDAPSGHSVSNCG